tara:strand:+ start:1499 stop:2104 length:606 start_codon:yes stop_codon:yes gene_type:complete
VTPTGSVTRTLAFNGYRFGDGTVWLNGASAEYSAARLDNVLEVLVETLGAVIVRRSSTDYEPRGASAGMLIGQPASAFAHLTESHVAVHTYPDEHPGLGLAVLRVECEISSCGSVPPTDCLHLLVDTFRPDLLTLDLRDRGLVATAEGFAPALNALAPDSLNGFTAALLRAGFGAYVREALDRRRAAIVSGLLDQWADSFG